MPVGEPAATARERERRLAMLEAAAALRAKAEAANAVADLLEHFSTAQLRVLLEAARDFHAGKLTETEADAAVRACPGIADVLASAGAACSWLSRP